MARRIKHWLNNSDAIDLRTEAQKWLVAYKKKREVQEKCSSVDFYLGVLAESGRDITAVAKVLSAAKNEEWKYSLAMHRAALHMSELLRDKVPRWIEYDDKGFGHIVTLTNGDEEYDDRNHSAGHLAGSQGSFRRNEGL